MLNAIHALPDARPVWRAYACVTLVSSFSGTLRLDFVLRTRDFQGRTRWFWALIKVVKIGARSTKDAGLVPVLHFR
ncbi:MAG: hypothetical protein EOO27_36610 [Comamonadaceae bacterium]|nr:MAG: hypothetical protein EOO27_36610 [Comamonadaceae bacterium]